MALPGDLRVGVHTDYPPLVFESSGRIVGVEADLAHRVGEELGRRIRFVPMERSELIEALEAGRIDVIMAGLSITPERRRRVRFIEPYVRVGQMAMIRRSRVPTLGPPSQLRRAGMRVGFVAGTTGETLVRGSLREARPVALDSVAAAEQALREGRIDFFIHDAPTAWRLGMDLQERDLMGLYRPLTEEWLAWAVRPGDRDLALRLDALARRWRVDGSVERILNTWVPVRITQ